MAFLWSDFNNWATFPTGDVEYETSVQSLVVSVNARLIITYTEDAETDPADIVLEYAHSETDQTPDTWTTYTTPVVIDVRYIQCKITITDFTGHLSNFTFRLTAT